MSTCPRPTGSVNVLTSGVQGDKTVDRHNSGSIKAKKGHTVNSANFRDDLNKTINLVTNGQLPLIGWTRGKNYFA